MIGGGRHHRPRTGAGSELGYSFTDVPDRSGSSNQPGFGEVRRIVRIGQRMGREGAARVT